MIGLMLSSIEDIAKVRLNSNDSTILCFSNRGFSTNKIGAKLNWALKFMSSCLKCRIHVHTNQWSYTRLINLLSCLNQKNNFAILRVVSLTVTGSVIVTWVTYS